MDPFTWTNKGRTTSHKLYTTALCRYRMLPWRPTGSDGRLRRVVWVGQEYLRWWCDTIMMTKISGDRLKLINKDWAAGCNGCCRRKWTQKTKSKLWTRLLVLQFTQMPIAKALIHNFYFQLWVNSRADCTIYGDWSRRKTLTPNQHYSAENAFVSHPTPGKVS